MANKIVFLVLLGVIAFAWTWLYNWTGNSDGQGLLVFFSILAASKISLRSPQPKERD